jgi:cell division septation protein DedD
MLPMMPSLSRTRSPMAALLAFVLAALVSSAGAQSPKAPTDVSRPANDSLFRHARRLVLDGNGVTGRALVDSLLAAATPGSAAYGDALYWHGALASVLTDAERDYRRVIVEYPLAYYADDALLALAELEQGRGDHAAALAHLQRFVHEHPASPARGIAALGAARLAFDQQHDARTGCAMITEAKASVRPGDVELANQIEYYASRCPTAPPTTVARMGSVPTKGATAVDTQSVATRSGVPRAMPDPLPLTPDAAAPAASAASSVPVAAPVTSTPVVARPAPRPAPQPVPQPPATRSPSPRAATSRAITPHGRWTIQLAAYNTAADAERLVDQLKSKGLAARVSGTAKPFRVRLDFYRTRADAQSAVAALRARKIIGFVTTEP